MRKENLSSREILVRRKLFTNEELPLDDELVRKFKIEDIKKQNLALARSKAKVKIISPSAKAKKGTM